MPLIEELTASGEWLFRWRSYLPLAMFGLMVASFRYFTYPFDSILLDQLWECFCLLLGMFGLFIRGLVAGYVPGRTSGRNTREQVADSLNTTGMYSVVRNPLYLGNFFVGLGIVMFLRVWWIPLIYLLSFKLYYERIVLAEENFLREKFGEEYLAWAAHTPAFIPKWSQWRKPSLPLSWRTLLRREYQSAYGFILALFLLEQLTEWYLGHGWEVEAMWQWIVGLSTAIYLIVRFLHKKTDFLHVEGR